MTRLIYLVPTLILSVPAHAASANAATVPTIVAGVVAVVCAALAVKFKRDAVTARSTQADMLHKIALNKASAHQLREAHDELLEAIAAKDKQLKHGEQELAQTSEQLVGLRSQLERVARVDGHTGIANKQHYLETLGEEIKRAVRHRLPITLLLGEIDFFDDYVEINGQERGDYVVQVTAAAVSRTFRRAGDLVARVGPKRFAVILPEADVETGKRFAEKFRRTVYELCVPFPGSDAADRVTISVGAVTVPPKRLHERDEVEALANVALEQAQAEGCNRVALSAHAA